MSQFAIDIKTKSQLEGETEIKSDISFAFNETGKLLNDVVFDRLVIPNSQSKEFVSAIKHFRKAEKKLLNLVSDCQVKPIQESCNCEDSGTTRVKSPIGTKYTARYPALESKSDEKNDGPTNHQFISMGVQDEVINSEQEPESESNSNSSSSSSYIPLRFWFNKPGLAHPYVGIPSENKSESINIGSTQDFIDYITNHPSKYPKTAIIGPSNTGKTTLAELITDNIPMDSRIVTVDPTERFRTDTPYDFDPKQLLDDIYQSHTNEETYDNWSITIDDMMYKKEWRRTGDAHNDLWNAMVLYGKKLHITSTFIMQFPISLKPEERMQFDTVCISRIADRNVLDRIWGYYVKNHGTVFTNKLEFVNYVKNLEDHEFLCLPVNNNNKNDKYYNRIFVVNTQKP